MMVNKFLTESNEALARVSKYQSQVDSTKRIGTIADDPQATLLALRARNKLSNLELYSTNISMASSYLQEVESAVMEIDEILKSAYEDIVDASSGAKEPEDLAAMAEKMKNLRDEVLAISNSSMGASYLFGGFNYTGSHIGGVKNPPFSVDSVTGDLTYNGSIYRSLPGATSIRITRSGCLKAPRKSRPLSPGFQLRTAIFYNKSQASQAVEELDKLLAAAGAAMEDAKEFGIDTTWASFVQFESFYNDLKDAADKLNFQVSKEHAEDGVVYDPDELANKFSSADVLTEQITCYLP
jgi:flagellin-like hook-associated protein FlgL